MLYALFSADDLLLPVHHGLAVSYLRIPTREAEPEEETMKGESLPLCCYYPHCMCICSSRDGTGRVCPSYSLGVVAKLNVFQILLPFSLSLFQSSPLLFLIHLPK
ncbi:unnamed protein product [Brugia pahangi]|uniref:Secreted protein n=1 Tax=Brugia pahangi TaxID=6280 RepID=A0A0N4SZJ4_BRUPA|nr:unnamed protein product [Brugia pahangi]